MPVYDVEHICKLDEKQQDELAEAITKIHSEKFNTPRLFVNVNIKDISNIRTYVAGKKRANNRIIANVRHGPSRTQAMYNELCSEVAEAWKRIVGDKGDQEFRAIFVLGSIVAGYEAGFNVPPAGGDAEWLKTNLIAFKEKADAGDGDFQDMIEDIKSRAVFKDLAKEL